MTAPDVSGTVGAAARLLVDDLVVGYDRPIVHGLDLEVLDGAFTAIVGPNACGKSTLLRAMARLLVPTQGAVLLDGRSVAEMPTRTVAKEIGLLPQSATAPDGLLVADLVARARFPHRSWYDRWSMADERAVQEAMAEAGVDSLADRPVDELSGGQRQRVWLALCLAQETPILLLDEPTTYLDLAHQIDVLELIRRLQHDHGRTVVAVLHDLQHASRYADRIVAMGGGRLVAVGTPAEVLVPEVIEDVYGIGCVVIEDPVTGGPLAVPTVSR